MKKVSIDPQTLMDINPWKKIITWHGLAGIITY